MKITYSLGPFSVTVEATLNLFSKIFKQLKKWEEMEAAVQTKYPHSKRKMMNYNYYDYLCRTDIVID